MYHSTTSESGQAGLPGQLTLPFRRAGATIIQWNVTTCGQLASNLQLTGRERKKEPVADTKLANPGALGLGGFALTTFLLSVVNAGLIDGDNLGMVLPLALFYGGLAQFCAGMWDVKRGDIFGATCFSSFGMFWIAVATMILFENAGLVAPGPREGVGGPLI